MSQEVLVVICIRQNILVSSLYQDYSIDIVLKFKWIMPYDFSTENNGR